MITLQTYFQVTGNVTGPIFDSPSIQDNLTLITDPSLPSHQTRLLRNDVEDFVLFDRDVLCHFRVRMSGREGNMVSNAYFTKVRILFEKRM